MSGVPSSLIRERLTSQMLAGPRARDPLAVAERMLAMQSQDLRGAQLAIRARGRGLGLSDVSAALGDGSLLVTWLNRGTLHTVRTEDYHWLHALTTPPLFVGNARRLLQEGVEPKQAEQAVLLIERALSLDGPQTRRQLKELLDAAGIPTAGQALIHLLMLTCLRGIAVRGPMVGGEQAYALVRDLPSKPARPDRDRALGELALRYLRGHGPASERDLAKWAGLPLRDARAGLQRAAPHIEEYHGGLVRLRRRPRTAEMPAPRLLGAFEPLLLGWDSRDDVLGKAKDAVIAGAIFRPFALIDGRAAATWRLEKGEVAIEPTRRLTREEAAALERDAREVEGFFRG